MKGVPARTWRVTGESKEGSPGERATFTIGIKRDCTGWIATEMQYATDEAFLHLSAEQLRGLRDALNRLFEQQSN